ncbi:MAG: hypothetical protein QM689_05300 [Oscillospiraceae bacterium]
MDFNAMVFHTIKRAGLMLLVNLFAVVFVPILTGVVVSVYSLVAEIALPFSDLSTFAQYAVGSFAGSMGAWLVLALMLGLVFWRDGKLHTAYEIYSPVNELITLLLMFFLYFAPVLLIGNGAGTFSAFSAMGAGYRMFYYPSFWMRGALDDTGAAALTGLALTAVLLILYMLSHRLYAKKFTHV